MSGSVYVQPRAPRARDLNMYFTDTSPKIMGPAGTLYDKPELSPAQSYERGNSTAKVGICYASKSGFGATANTFNFCIRISNVKIISESCCYQLDVASDAGAASKQMLCMGTYKFLKVDQYGLDVWKHSTNDRFLLKEHDARWSVSTVLRTNDQIKPISDNVYVTNQKI